MSKSVNQKEQGTKELILQGDDLIKKELESKTTEDLKKLRNKLAPTRLKKLCKDEQYKKYLSYGYLTEDQAKNALLRSVVPAAIVDGLAGILLPINIIKVFVPMLPITLGAVAFGLLAVATSVLASLLGGLAIYIYYRSAYESWERNDYAHLYLANARKRILKILTRRQEEEKLDEVISIILALNELKINLSANSDIKELLGNNNDNSFDSSGLDRLVEFFADKNNQDKIFQSLNGGLDLSREKFNIKDDNASSLHKISGNEKAKEVTNNLQPENKSWYQLMASKITLIFTGAGVAFAAFAGGYLGLHSLLSIMGGYLAWHGLLIAASAIVSPVGIGIVVAISIGIGCYFGYKYACKSKEIEACREERANAEEEEEEIKNIEKNNKKQLKKLKDFKENCEKKINRTVTPELPHQDNDNLLKQRVNCDNKVPLTVSNECLYQLSSRSLKKDTTNDKQAARDPDNSNLSQLAPDTVPPQQSCQLK